MRKKPKPKPAPPALIGGPYLAPPFEVGSSLVCRVHGRVQVHSISSAPAHWPQRHQGYSKVPIFTAELVRAIRTESSAAICYWWGVNRKTVTRWRRRLGAPRFTLGTQLLWSRLATKLHRKAARPCKISARSKPPVTPSGP